MTEIIFREPTEEELAEQAQWVAEAPARERAFIEETRRQAYQREADPLFFGWQRGDNTEAEWLAAVDKIKADYPYPTS